MENRNSADYMELGRIVKVRRRQVFSLNILIRPENTPLFPTGELGNYPCYSETRLPHHLAYEANTIVSIANISLNGPTCIIFSMSSAGSSFPLSRNKIPIHKELKISLD